MVSTRLISLRQNFRPPSGETYNSLPPNSGGKRRLRTTWRLSFSATPRHIMPSPLSIPAFPDLAIDQKPVPATLQKMKDQALRAVEEAEAHEVAIEPVEERAHKQGRLPVHAFAQPALSLDGIAERVGLNT